MTQTLTERPTEAVDLPRLQAMAEAAGWEITAPGVSALRCERCLTAIPKEKADESHKSLFQCHRCLHVTVTALAAPGFYTINPDAAVFLDDNEVRGTVWYHATLHEDWMAKLLEAAQDFAKVVSGHDPNAEYNVLPGEGETAIPMVHLGTFGAALERAIDLDNPFDNPEGKRWYIYKVIIKADAAINPLINGDDDLDGEMRAHLVGKDDRGYETYIDGVNRYVNRVESPGSISLVVNPLALEILSVEKV